MTTITLQKSKQGRRYSQLELVPLRNSMMSAFFAIALAFDRAERSAMMRSQVSACNDNTALLFH